MSREVRAQAEHSLPPPHGFTLSDSSLRGTAVKTRVKLSKLLDKSEVERKNHILDFCMHCSFLAQI